MTATQCKGTVTVKNDRDSYQEAERRAWENIQASLDEGESVDRRSLDMGGSPHIDGPVATYHFTYVLKGS
ncbi:hypothetical protein [Mycolicibacterium aichiense]|uniref:Uncharacterized protein n=1 Tax=Mycolicibacterium aichiense TaxID=1799 RepID=A0AAD1HJ85_9MYCO|nr:hypothetical protein [Mycolicibacterium aichiense]MCV7017983.1 hypothetical protein [Mycolicibacterium aichiense]BBX06400.1 hypothetical protein MAIC_12030 [Mycolicibacterium aichiense]STZ24263.1 Uncharacterised protein [Mycolicibacterium aichiense]